MHCQIEQCIVCNIQCKNWSTNYTHLHFFKTDLFIFMCNGDLPACVSYVMLSDPLTGDIDSCELLCG